MQRKYIYGFIALGFAISLELVLALHLMQNTQKQPERPQLVSTIDIHRRSGQLAGQEAGEAAIEQGTALSELSLLEESAQDELAAPDGLAQETISPDAGYPAIDENLLSADARLDDDHVPGSEPDDADWSVGASADNGYPAPDGDNSSAGGDYPPPNNNNTVDPTPVPPTATAPVPTDIPALPTATAALPTATQAPVMTSTATPEATTGATQPQATSTSAPPQAGGPGLVSLRAAAAPNLDGSADDTAWASAQAVTVDTTGGANQSATRVTIKSVFDDEQVYFLLTWSDPGQSLLLNPWEKQNDGSWKKLVGGQNQGGDESEFYQDKLALLWPINNSLPDFAANGCAGACHSGEGAPDKAVGLMFTGGPDQLGDLWQLKTVVNAGQVDDGYLDSTPYSKDTPWAGFHADPGKGGYHANQDKDHSGPAYMPKDGGEKTGAPGYILDAEKEKIAEELFQPGERVPGILKEPFEGDRGDIRAGWKYQDGAWMLEIARKRVTGSAFDVQFDDLDKSYFFGLASFDNTQVRHAVQSGVVAFTFMK